MAHAGLAQLVRRMRPRLLFLREVGKVLRRVPLRMGPETNSLFISADELQTAAHMGAPAEPKAPRSKRNAQKKRVGVPTTPTQKWYKLASIFACRRDDRDTSAKANAF